MKIFIICYVLFIHVNMCIYIMHMFIESPYCSYYFTIQSGFRTSAGLVLGTDYHLNRCSVRFRVWVHRDSTQSKSAPLPSLDETKGSLWNNCHV